MPFPDFSEEESTYLMEQLKEIERARHISDKLNLWDVIRTKVFRNCKHRTYRLNPFRGNWLGRKNKKDTGNFDSLHIRGGYFELPEALEDSTETEHHRHTQQANTSARRSEGSSSTQVQVNLGKLKRSGAIRGRKPRGGLPTTNRIQESRMVRAYVNSSEFRTSTYSGESSRSNGEPSTSNTGNMDQAPAPQVRSSILRHETDPLLPRPPKRVQFAPNVHVVLEHQACSACSHRTQSEPFTDCYNDEDAPGLSSASASASSTEPELEDLSWTQAPSGIRFLSTEKVRRLMERESYALRTMGLGARLKRDVVCFAWGDCASPERLRWLEGFVVGEVTAGVDVDCSWLSGAQVQRDM